MADSSHHKYRVASVLLAIVLVGLSVVPDDPQAGDTSFVWLVSVTPTLLQKTMHVVLYGTFAVLLFASQTANRRPALRLVVAAAIAVGLGAILEWIQLSVPGRFGTLIDVMLNTIGAMTGLAFALILNARYGEGGV